MPVIINNTKLRKFSYSSMGSWILKLTDVSYRRQMLGIILFLCSAAEDITKAIPDIPLTPFKGGKHVFAFKLEGILLAPLKSSLFPDSFKPDIRADLLSLFMFNQFIINQITKFIYFYLSTPCISKSK